MKSNTTIPCIVCNESLDNLEYELRDGTMCEVHPMGGLHFSTRGHYGSTIFDPMGTGETLDIAICDTCVLNNIDKVRGSGKKSLE